MNSKIKNRLFEHLDECGIHFRKSKGELVSAHGRRNSGWVDDLEYCEVQGRLPFINNLIHPLVFQFSSDTDLLLPANFFKSYIRDSTDCHENYRFAVTQLTEIFGTH